MEPQQLEHFIKHLEPAPAETVLEELDALCCAARASGGPLAHEQTLTQLTERHLELLDSHVRTLSDGRKLRNTKSYVSRFERSPWQRRPHQLVADFGLQSVRSERTLKTLLKYSAYCSREQAMERLYPTPATISHRTAAFFKAGDVIERLDGFKPNATPYGLAPTPVTGKRKRETHRQHEAATPRMELRSRKPRTRMGLDETQIDPSAHKDFAEPEAIAPTDSRKSINEAKSESEWTDASVTGYNTPEIARRQSPELESPSLLHHTDFSCMGDGARSEVDDSFNHPPRRDELSVDKGGVQDADEDKPSPAVLAGPIMDTASVSSGESRPNPILESDMRSQAHVSLTEDTSSRTREQKLSHTQRRSASKYTSEVDVTTPPSSVDDPLPINALASAALSVQHNHIAATSSAAGAAVEHITQPDAMGIDRALQCLEDRHWLNDEAISKVLSLFSIGFPECLVIDASMVHLDDNSLTPRLLELPLRNLTNEHAMIVVPIALHQLHWVAAIFDCACETVKVFDPMHTSQNINSAISALERWVKRVPKLACKSWKYERVSCRLEQKDTFNCGIYVTVWLVHRMLSLEVPMNIQPDLWRRVFHALISSQHQPLQDDAPSRLPLLTIDSIPDEASGASRCMPPPSLLSLGDVTNAALAAGRLQDDLANSFMALKEVRVIIQIIDTLPDLAPTPSADGAIAAIRSSCLAAGISFDETSGINVAKLQANVKATAERRERYCNGIRSMRQQMALDEQALLSINHDCRARLDTHLDTQGRKWRDVITAQERYVTGLQSAAAEWTAA